jgi:hypothetical protein
MYATKKKLTEIKGGSEQKVDKIQPPRCISSGHRSSRSQPIEGAGQAAQ